MTDTITLFNVMDYGAVHDNSTDDAAHIQSAINACSTAGGGVVYLPAGTYRVNAAHASGSPLINQNMNIPSNVTIRGAGIPVTTLNGTGIASASVFGASQQTNIAVENLSITVTKANHSSDGDGIKLQGVSNSTFTNVYIENAYIASNCIGCQNIVYTNCECYNTIQGFACINNGEGTPGQYEATDNVTYNGCEASYCEQCGFYAHYLTAQGGRDAARVKNVTFHDCYSHDNAWNGFYGWWTYDVTLDGCMAIGNNKGIDLHEARGYLITGCTVTSSGESDITTLDNSTSRIGTPETDPDHPVFTTGQLGYLVGMVNSELENHTAFGSWQAAGDGTTTSFTAAPLARYIVDDDTLAVEVGGAVTTDFTMNFDSGVITFDIAPAPSVSLTAKFNHSYWTNELVAQAVNAGINNLFPAFYVPKADTSISLVANAYEYPLPPETQFITAVETRADATGAYTKMARSRYEWLSDGDHLSLRFFSTPTGFMRVRCINRPSPLIELADSLEDTAGLPARAKDPIISYACWYLLTQKIAPRIRSDIAVNTQGVGTLSPRQIADGTQAWLMRYQLQVAANRMSPWMSR